MSFACDILLINVVLFALGVWILVKGSDWFVDAAAELARSFGVPELVIGLTLVSIGTSLPELASSLCASFYKESNFIIGNIVGSNTANIAFILGTGLLLGGTLNYSRSVVRRDMPILLLLGLGLIGWFYLGVDAPQNSPAGLGRIGGLILLAVCAFYSLLLCREQNTQDAATTEAPAGEQPAEVVESPDAAASVHRGKAFGLLFFALLLITAGAKLMVDTVVWSAAKMGVNPLMISLTVVAIGTSLPELAVTISGILKKRNDIALGNIIGSGIYNIVLILGSCAVINPLTGDLRNSLLAMVIMNVVTLLLFLFMLRGTRLYRWQGVCFLILYAAFVAWSVCCVK